MTNTELQHQKAQYKELEEELKRIMTPKELRDDGPIVYYDSREENFYTDWVNEGERLSGIKRKRIDVAMTLNALRTVPDGSGLYGVIRHLVEQTDLRSTFEELNLRIKENKKRIAELQERLSPRERDAYAKGCYADFRERCWDRQPDALAKSYAEVYE